MVSGEEQPPKEDSGCDAPEQDEARADAPPLGTPAREERIASSRKWAAAAAFVFFACALTLFRSQLGADWTADVPARVYPGRKVVEGQYPSSPVILSDHRFMVWQIFRNSEALLFRPHRFFEAAPCHPAAKSLAFGEHNLTIGLVGVPARIFSDEPVLVFDFVLVASSLLAALALFLLIRDFTGEPAAGIVAGVLYAFHPVKIGDPVHFFIWESGWTALALLFATRLLRAPSWSAAIGLAAMIVLQIGGSYYALVAAFLLAVPVAVALLFGSNLRAQKPAQWVAILGIVGIAGALIMGPYLSRTASGALEEQPLRFYFAYQSWLPGEPSWPGFMLIGLVLVSLFASRRRVFLLGGPSKSDLRWPLLVGGLFVLLVAAGGTTGDEFRALVGGRRLPFHLPNPYPLLARFVPGMSLVRSPLSIYTGFHLVLCILAGLGAGAILRWLPRRFAVAGAVLLIACAYVSTLRPPILGLDPPVEYTPYRIRPDDEILAFFENLARAGDSGPILELPANADNIFANAESTLFTAYHHRRTSRCMNSHRPPEVAEVDAIAARLPTPAALEAARERGFTTLVVHHPSDNPFGAALREKLDDVVDARGGLRPLARTPSLSGYALEP